MQLILFTGLQASGKSMFYQHYFYHTHLRINLDMLKTRHREAIIFEAALASKTKMVIDNTNICKIDRMRYIQAAKSTGFEIISYYFETNLDDALRRNAQRTGKACIPEKGVKATFYKLEVPSALEGFDARFKVKLDTNNNFIIQSIQE